MPFTTIDVKKEIEKTKQKDPSFAQAWEESREEYRLIHDMISLRKKEKVTQTKLAELIGSKQQVISKIEKREQNPSLEMVCNILDALGYRLEIVKK